jgi:hypothetical protein
MQLHASAKALWIDRVTLSIELDRNFGGEEE